MLVGVDVGPLTAGVLGGLGLFLLGLRRLTDALKALAGQQLRMILTRLTTNRFAGMFTGTLVTALVQSSSVTTVLAVGFVTAGVMSFVQALGVVLGANVGTTITAQVIAFDIRTWALALVAAGAAGLLVGKNERLALRADAVLGLGLVFFGMQIMSEAMVPLRTSPTFIDVMAELRHPLLGLAAGAVFTALVQSSSATTALAITLSGTGLIELDAGVAIILGANVGTCVTAGLAAVGKPPEAVRVAAAHVIINVAGALLWVGFTRTLAGFAVDLAPGEGTDSVRRQLANAHTIFNVSSALLFLPLLGPLARLLERLIPERPGPPPPPSRLEDDLISTPALALQAAQRELEQLATAVVAMLQQVPSAVFRGSAADLDDLARADDEVDARYRELVDYLGRVGRQPMTEELTGELMTLLAAAGDLENMGDVIETNLVSLGRRRLVEATSISPATLAVLDDVHWRVAGAVEDAVRGVLHHDREAARSVVGLKADLHHRIGQATRHQAGRLIASEPRRPDAYALEVDLLENLRRVYYFARRLARAELPALDPGDAAPNGEVPPDSRA